MCHKKDLQNQLIDPSSTTVNARIKQFLSNTSAASELELTWM
jgi:hypothetical protein